MGGEPGGETAYGELDAIAATLSRASEEMDRLDRELKLRTRELSEARQQQAATAEAIKAISRPDTDLQTVFDALVKSAAKLSASGQAAMYLRDGEMLSGCASFGTHSKKELDQPLAIDRTTIFGRVMLSGQAEFISDTHADPHYDRARLPTWSNCRALMAVPLVRQGQIEGVLSVGQAEPGAFAARQSEFMQGFADQAVIAIENAFLIDEERARGRELAATSEVLRVISRSAADIQPVFDAIAESARRLCEGQYSLVLRFDGSHLHFAACDGLDPHAAEALRRTFPLEPGRDSAGGRAVLSGAVEQIPDVAQDPEYAFSGHAKMLNTGSAVAVPMLQRATPVGAIVLGRTQTGLVPDRQVKLVQTFADQAAIAIQTALLIEDGQARNRELSSASEILRAISRFPTDVRPVFEAIAQTVRRLCNAHISSVFRFDGSHLHFMACDGLDPHAADAFRRAFPLKPSRDSAGSRAVLSGAVEQIPDVGKDPDYVFSGLARKANIGSVVAVPMLREGAPIGAIVLDRTQTGHFPDHQVKLLQAFADKAVIALENVRLFEEVQARNRDLTEALEQQTATGAVLRAIAASPTNVQPVLDAVAESAARLCEAYDVVILLKDGGTFSTKAHHGPIPIAQDSWPIGRDSVAGCSVLDGAPMHLHDAMEAADEFPVSYEWAVREGQRTVLAVPLLREGAAIGALVLRRREVQPFSRKQIDLLTTFAAQAVIAIENARLFEEVRARNRQLTEALEQQTGTSAILRAIAASPTEIQPVLDAVAESAARLCEAFDSIIFLKDGDALAWKAHHGAIPLDFASRPIARDWVTGRAFVDRAPVHVHDLRQAAGQFPASHGDATRQGHRTILALPLMREQEAIGALVIRRLEVRPFTQQQIDLLTTFADQAVIAIENVRLFEQVQMRTRELQEALDHQTATGEVLNVISRSTSQLQPVLDAIVETAVRLCEADFAVVTMLRDGMHHLAAANNVSDELVRYLAEHPPPPGRGSLTGRTALESRPVHIPDVLADPEYSLDERQKIGRYRAMLGVPLLRGGEVIGTINLLRTAVRPFTAKQIELVTTFADQAVIAIENVRLFEQVQARNRELTEALEQQAATAEILRTINATPTDAQPVFEAIVRNAVSLCGSLFANVFRFDGELLHWVASHNVGPSYVELVKAKYPMRPDLSQVSGRVLLTKSVVRLEDALADADYDQRFPRAMGWRRMLGTPLLCEGNPLGVLVVGWAEPGPIAKADEELLKTFADQAVIAIENVRLFEEVQARTRELQETLDHQTATSEVLNVISRSPSVLQPVLDVIIETAVRLCDADAGTIDRQQEGQLVRYGGYGFSPEFNELMTRAPAGLSRGTITGRTCVEGKMVHVLDVEADPEYAWREALELGGMRTALGVPLLREGVAIGAIALIRRAVRPFTDKQIELLTTFADQAVIAIENVRLFEEVQARNRDLTEALEQQTATGAILRAIAASPTDIQPVLTAVAESAAKLCGAYDAAIRLKEGDGLALRAHHGPIPIDFDTWPIGRDWVAGRAFLDRKPVQVGDMHQAADEFPAGHAMAARLGHLTILAVPLLREDEAIGALVIRRQEVRPFSAKQIDLLTTFADQAVIAIENVRLFDEVKVRTGELSEALQQQTATADVLKAISRSTFDLPVVLKTLTASAVKLCGASHGGILLRRGELLHVGAAYGGTAEDEAELIQHPLTVDRRTVSGRVALSGQVEHIPDIRADAEYDWPFKGMFSDIRALMGVPLLHEGRVGGAFFLGRPEPGAFSSRQNDIVQTFADQAVIAIKNVRLFDEVQARTRELSEALKQQTATAEVLQVISRATFDLQTVLDTLVESVARLCEADHAWLFRREAEEYRWAASYGFSHDQHEQMKKFLMSQRIVPGRTSIIGRVALEGKLVHVADVTSDPEYEWRELQSVGRYHTAMGVPLVREGVPIGVMTVTRLAERPFTDRQIGLMQTFADQAVIAIENVRLFEEVRSRTAELARSVGELQALGEVSQAVNSTLDLKTVLETIVAKAVQLSETDAGAIYVYSKSADRFRLRATYGMSAELIEEISRQTIGLRDPGPGEAAQRRAPVEVADLREESRSPAQDILLAAGFRSFLVVPLLRPGKVVGALVVRRRTPGRFAEPIVRLLETFAAQSVLAIQNARLFSEIEEKGHQLEVASRHKSQFLANMSHELRTPLNSVLGFTEMLADGLYGELPEKARATLARVQANGRHLLGLINDVLDLSKIEAGQLTLTIDDYSIGQIVRTVTATTEPLAQEKGLKLSATVAEGLPMGRGDERRLSQVLLNLVGNAVKFTEQGSIEISAEERDGSFQVLVRDTGPGIAPEHQKRIFEEFQQVDESSTRQKGGTGLGLAISKRIIEMHGGTIGLDSELGRGSTFRVAIPVRADEQVEAA